MLMLAATENDTLDRARRFNLSTRIGKPALRVTDNSVLAQKAENNSQVMAVLRGVVDRQDMTVEQHRQGGFPVGALGRARHNDSTAPHSIILGLNVVRNDAAVK